MDVLSDALRVLRLSGAVLFRADFSSPWDVSSPSSDLLAQALMPGAGRLVLFHVITGGQCWAEVEGEPRIQLRSGDVVVFPYGDAHVMGRAEGAKRVSVIELLPMPPWPEPPHVCSGGGGDITSLMCGFLHCDDALFNPLLAALPRLFSVSTAEGPHAQWLELMVGQSLNEAIGEQPGSGALLTRLAELLFLDVLRRYMAQQDTPASGLLAALHDEHIACALEVIHATPAEPWTVDRLAHRIGMSRSALAARFKELLGMPPMHYVTRLRLQEASHLIRNTGESIGAIAHRVGYESEAAFTRAFKRYVGQPPATWRKHH